jgi:glycosyltransferase involved in cell wall biosynthesis
MTPAGAPTVSIGVPVYNSERFVERTLRSLLDQTFRNLELIISDNASTDSTAELCQRLAHRDPRIVYVRQVKNVGVNRNYNAVLALARGKYFKWSSSNDICQPQLLERCVAVLEARPDAVLAYAKTRLFDEDAGTVHDYEDNMDLQEEDPVRRYAKCGERLLLNNIINAVIRTESLKATTLNWDYASSDMQLTQELALHGKFIEIPEFLFYRRMDEGARYGGGSKETYREYYPDDKFDSSGRPWLRLAQRLRGAAKAPLGVRERVRLHIWIARCAWWERHELFGVRPRERGLDVNAADSMRRPH